MKKKYLLELAELIPSRNINFYLDACIAMDKVDLRTIETSGNAGIEPEKLNTLIIDGGRPQAIVEMMMDYLTCIGKDESTSGMKQLGYVLLNNISRQEDQNEGVGPSSKLPFIFTGYAIVKDLIFSGYGPNYSFVGRLLAELAEDKVICSCVSDRDIEMACRKYSHEDMAAIFLGYSLANDMNRGPLIPFPLHPTGFSASLRLEAQTLLPRTCTGDDRW